MLAVLGGDTSRCDLFVCPAAGTLALPDVAGAAAPNQAGENSDAAQAGLAAAGGALPPLQEPQQGAQQPAAPDGQSLQLSVEQLMAMLPPDQGLSGQQGGSAEGTATGQPHEPGQAG